MITNQDITVNSVVTQAKGNIVSDMGGEKVMLSVTRGKYFNLGEIGGEIWDLMSQPLSVQEIVTQLVTSFDVDSKECEEQVVDFLESLSKEGLIEITN
ncbi:lasso peptide biosynthesis PqqD family chaperone [Fredinandcohnia sp. 179-A 10B2 NHS]|uniref:lasso peptide biosynthesis PqqD family chaperone n=1 Tax=Fredinandcohnia sp. 179-A 10B2 NHS TaxID=3235176 RepID=UPI0039A367E9